jgi:hypothetical protein
MNIEKLFDSIAEYLFDHFHNTFVGEINVNYLQNPNKHKIFQATIMAYGNRICSETDMNFSSKEFGKMCAFYNSRNGECLNSDTYITDIMQCLTPPDFREKVRNVELFICMRNIIGQLCETYTKYLAIKNDRLYFESDITPELRCELICKLRYEFKKIGISNQYSLCTRWTNDMVPRKLYDRIHKKCAKLERKLEELES